MTAVAAAIKITPYYYRVFFYIINFLRDGRRKLNSFYFAPGTIAYAAGPSLRSQIRKKEEHMTLGYARDDRIRVIKEGA